MTEPLTFTGQYERCLTCKAPAVVVNGRMPEDWWITLRREGMTNLFMPHLPECERVTEARERSLRPVFEMYTNDVNPELVSLLLGDPT